MLNLSDCRNAASMSVRRRSTEMSGEIMPLLSNNRQVIVVDLQAHGRTADIDRTLSPPELRGDGRRHRHADQASRDRRADIMGYSLGVGVALRIAVRHPDLVRNLVLVSTPFKRDG